jgi:serine-aspartate repeat-containing protein C/D/E
VILALLVLALGPAAAQATHADPPAPVYSKLLGDCVTGNNQFYSTTGGGKYRWWINQGDTSDGSEADTVKCDSYTHDQYERPTNEPYQTQIIAARPDASGNYTNPPANPLPATHPVWLSGMSPDAEFGLGQSVYATMGSYFEIADITRGEAGSAPLPDDATHGWMFFRIELFGDATVSDAGGRSVDFGAGTYYSVRLGQNANPNKANNGVLLRNECSNSIDDGAPAGVQDGSAVGSGPWKDKECTVKIFADLDGTASDPDGAGDPLSGGVTTPAENVGGGNGYEVDQGNNPQGTNGWLYARRTNVACGAGCAAYPFTTKTRPTIEFAFNYEKYNADVNDAGSRDFTPTNVTYSVFDATKGLTSPANYFWNDKYNQTQAGSPNFDPLTGASNGGPGGTALDGLENIYELDSLGIGALTSPGSISGQKWHDLDADGVKDGGEPGLENWTIYLDSDGDNVQDGGEPSTTTNASGNYTFSNLAPGNYDVREVLQANWVCSFPASTCEHSAVAVASGQNVTGIDFGNYQNVAPSGVKYHDLNADGDQDGGEPGLQNWTIYIDSDGDNVHDGGEPSTTTAANGSWTLPGQKPGSYEIREVTQANWFCSDPKPADGVPADDTEDCEFEVTLVSGTAASGLKFGNFQQVAPSGVKYHDLNADGDQDGGEPGLQNWTIYIDSDGDNVHDGGEPSTTTAANGSWTLPAQNPGSYEIREVTQANWFCSDPKPADGVPADDTEDCEFEITLVSGNAASGIKFGNFQQVAPSGVKYHDLNADGDQDGGEPGLQNWTIYIDQDNDNVHDGGEPSTTTAANGSWTLPAQDPGPIEIREVTQANWFCSDPKPADGAPADDTENCEFEITLVSGTAASGLKFGNFQQVAPSGVKYHDQNADGDQDGGEPGLENWTIYIDQDNDNVHDGGEPSTTTAANGSWTLPAQDPGPIEIREVTQANWFCSDPKPADGGSADDTENCEFEVTLVSGTAASGLKFGNFQQVAPSGTKYHDLNGDGDQDGGEPGLENWTIFIDSDGDNALDGGEPSTTTAANGSWTLPAQDPGAIEIREVTQANWTCSDPKPADGAPADDTENCEFEVTLVSGTAASGLKFGNHQQVAPSGVKYHDLNADGDQDGGENGLEHWRIYIDSNNDNDFDGGEPSVITDANGAWSLPAQNPGSYSIREEATNNVVGTWICSDPSTTDAAPADQTEACEFDVTLVSSTAASGLRFGNYQNVAPSGVKYHDLNADGDQDGGESGLQNWRVYIDSNNDNNFDAGEPNAITDADGNWTLPVQKPGSYSIREDQNTVTGTWFCSDPSTSDAAPADQSEQCEFDVTLVSGTATSGLKFGNYQNVAPSGVKYHDLNGDGDQDGGEPGLQNWTIFIDGNNNNALDGGETSTTTDSNGNWTLPGQKPGDYEIREVTQANWFCSDPKPADGTPADDTENCEFEITLVSGTAASGLKFGNFQQVAPSGTKYHDLNGDGDQDGGENGLEHWRVYIDSNGNNSFDGGEPSDVSDANGAWDLPAQNPGSYSIREEPTNNVSGTWLCSDPSTGDAAPADQSENCEFEATLVSGTAATGFKFGNYQNATVRITKNNIGGPAGDDFSFTPNGNLASQSPSPALSGGKFDLEHGEVQTFTAKPGGDYSVSEDNVTGYRLTEIACDDNDSTDRSSAAGLLGSDRSADVNVGSGETVTCTFSNTHTTSGIQVVKTGPSTAYHGDTVTYNYTVTNPGNSPIHDVVLTDNKCSSVQGPTKQEGPNNTDADHLDPGDTWTYNCQRAVPAHSSSEEDPIVNVATVTGKDEFDRNVSDDDDHSVSINHPAIDIDKTGPATATAGDIVTFTMEVTNTGDMPFAQGNVVIEDPQCIEPPPRDSVNGDSSSGTLNPGDRWTYSCRVQTEAGQTSVTNTAKVTGTDENGRKATDEDPATTELTAGGDIGGVRSGTARMAGKTGCVSKKFTVRVRGREIKRVTFTIDGRHKRVLRKPDKKGTYKITVNPRNFNPGAHMVKAVIQFNNASETATRSLRLRFERCVRRAAPAFTGKIDPFRT